MRAPPAGEAIFGSTLASANSVSRKPTETPWTQPVSTCDAPRKSVGLQANSETMVTAARFGIERVTRVPRRLSFRCTGSIIFLRVSRALGPHELHINFHRNTTTPYSALRKL